MADTAFPYYELAGTPAEIGRTYGNIARQPIQAALGDLLPRLAARTGLSHDTIQRRLDRCRADYDRYAPEVLQEIESLAAAAGISAVDALLCRTQWDVCAAPPAGCSAFVAEPVVTADGRMIGGQNKDIAPDRIDSVVIVRVSRGDTASVMAYSYIGMVEGPGFNSHGLCRFENSIHVPQTSRAIPLHLLKHLMNACARIDDCVELLTRLRADGVLGMAAGFTLGDATGRAACIEIVPGDFRVLEARQGIASRANSIQSRDFRHLDQAAADPHWRDSDHRDRRIAALLAAAQPLRVPQAQGILADHDGHPGSICRHAAHAATVAGIVCVPATGQFYASRGNPCHATWRQYGRPLT